jgi:hypothetical protein
MAGAAWDQVHAQAAPAQGQPGAQGQAPPPGGGRGRGGPGGRVGGPAVARTAAPVDLTGYWVSLVTDDWRYRMLTPPKGNVDYLPVNQAAREAANAWDPAKDTAAGEACKGYGALGVMRLPTRLNITWEGDNILKVDTDTGTQTRRLRFNAGQAPPPAGELDYQGYSVAQWQGGGGRGRRGGGPAPGATSGAGSELVVTTTRMKPGYIRKNGIPYSAQAVLTEYWFPFTDAGQQYLAITQKLEDPVYLNEPYVKTVIFMKQANGNGWNPTPCEAA